MVVRQVLVLFVEVRILVGQQKGKVISLFLFSFYSADMRMTIKAGKENKPVDFKINSLCRNARHYWILRYHEGFFPYLYTDLFPEKSTS